MTESKTKKTIRNVGWGLFYKSLSAFLPFISRTIIIQTLGMEYIGVGSLFSSLLTVLSLAELGISESIIFSMYKPLSEGDDEKICSLLNFYRKIYKLIGFVILVVGLLLMIWINFFVKGDYPSDINLRSLFLIYLLNTVSSYFLYSYMSVLLIANQRNDIEYKISSFICLIRDISQIVVLLLFKDYYIYIIILPITTIIHNIIRAICVRKRYPQFVCKGMIDYETKTIIKKQVGGLMVGKIVVASRNSLSSIIMSLVLGLSAVAIYSNYFYVMNAIYGFMIYFAAAMRGGIGNNVAVYTPTKNFADMLNLSYIFWWIYGICTVLLVCLYQPFMLCWVGENSISSFWTPILFSLYFYLQCSFLIFAQYMEAKGLYWENRLRYILEAFCNIVLSILFGFVWGTPGVVFATVLSMLFFANIYGSAIGFKFYFKKCNFKKYLFQQLYNLIVTIVACVISYIFCSFIHLKGIYGLLVYAIITSISSIMIFFIMQVATENFKNSKIYLNTRLLNKSKII